MATLHTVSRSPFRDSALESCLRLARPGSVLLLMEDGVYGALTDGALAGRVRDALDRHRVYALQADLAARGISVAALVDGVQVVDYEGFVDLACECSKVQAWL